MIEPMLETLAAQLPLKISGVFREGDALCLRGEGWSFNTPSVWRLLEGGRVQFACYDRSELVNKVDELVGLAIVDVNVQSTRVAVDPVFVLSDGREVEVFSTDTFEPWTMHLPNGEIFVSSPSENDAFAAR